MGRYRTAMSVGMPAIKPQLQPIPGLDGGGGGHGPLEDQKNAEHVQGQVQPQIQLGQNQAGGLQHDPQETTGPSFDPKKNASFQLEHHNDPRKVQREHQLHNQVQAGEHVHGAGSPSVAAGGAVGGEGVQVSGDSRTFEVKDDHIEVRFRDEQQRTERERDDLKRQLDEERRKAKSSGGRDLDDRIRRLKREIEELKGDARSYREGASFLERQGQPEDISDAAEWRNAAAGFDGDADKLKIELAKLMLEKAKAMAVVPVG